jgi:hypothetical protein
VTWFPGKKQEPNSYSFQGLSRLVDEHNIEYGVLELTPTGGMASRKDNFRLIHDILDDRALSFAISFEALDEISQPES